MAGAVPMATLIHMLTMKLFSTNYLIWRRQVLTVLSCHDLLSHVDGSTTLNVVDAQGKSTINDGYAPWKSKHQRVLSLLQSSLTYEALAEVLDRDSARDVCVTLEAAYSPSSGSRTHQLSQVHAAFFASGRCSLGPRGSRGTSSSPGGSHARGGSSSDGRGRGQGRRIPRCQIYHGEHYAYKCPNWYFGLLLNLMRTWLKPLVLSVPSILHSPLIGS
ncbi:hypothetical protein ACS0TY_027516 [Phlomoides rotata]